MKMARKLFLGLAACSALSVFADPANAALLSADFGTSVSPVAPGFTAVTASGTSVGPYTVSWLSNANTYSSGASDPLLRDFLYDNAGSSTLTVNIDGLTASTPYSLTLYSYNPDLTVSTNFSPGAGTTGPVLNVANNGSSLFTAASPLVQATGTYTSNGSGNLKLLVTGTTGDGYGPRFNGFVVTAVPEPSAAVLAITASAIGLGAYRRRTSRVRSI
ncbi:MAG: hypothetical protein WCO90_09565 [Planctomycetota bacterium]